MKTKKRKTTKITVPTALALICCFAVILIINNQPTENTVKDEIISLKDIPDYSGSAFIEINGNEPYFSDDDYTTSSLNTMRIQTNQEDAAQPMPALVQI